MKTPAKKGKKNKLSSISDDFVMINDNSTKDLSFSTVSEQQVNRTPETDGSRLLGPELSPFQQFQYDEYGIQRNLSDPPVFQTTAPDSSNPSVRQQNDLIMRRRLNSYNEAYPTFYPDDPINKTDDYLIKYKTEMCKNYEFKGFCKWKNEVS